MSRIGPPAAPGSASACSAARSIRRMPGTCTSPSGRSGRFGSTGSGGWSVPGNPLKPDAPADLARRMAAARRADARIRGSTVTDLEARLGTRYTAATLTALRRRYPGVRFVWLMGADNLAGFHRWERWRTIMAAVPVGVLARPGEQLRAGLSPAARGFARWRVPQRAARGAGRHASRRPGRCSSGRMLELSSSELRALGRVAALSGARR